MMRFLKRLSKNNKKGVTLVELVFGVVVLSIFAIGIITSLTAATTKIAKNAQESAVHSEAMQKLDAVISVVSNGSYSRDAEGNLRSGSSIASEVLGVLGYTDGTVALTMTPDPNTYLDKDGVEQVRGWKLSLTFKNVTVTGYTSNTEGVFDKDV